MHPPVEAQSLSSLLQIASNPPRYPRNPSEPKRDPLVLYIARVPGSQDVILTPLKPDLKNLKELDVASCLYYLHRNVPSGGGPAPPPPDTAIPTVNSLEPPRPSSPPPKPARRPLNDPISALPLKPPPLAPPRRPLGPRPLSLATPAAVPATEGQENAPLLPPRPYPEATTPTAAATSQARGRADTLFPTNPTSPNNHSPTHPKATEPYTITLIRRDPPTGAQWTIGSVLISPRSTPSVVVTLTTPGYTTFSNPPGDFRREINTDKPVTAARRRGHRRGHSAFSTQPSDQAPVPQPKDAQAYTFPSPCVRAVHLRDRAIRSCAEVHTRARRRGRGGRADGGGSG
ncbi:hypothetical protein VE04_04124, partial [Pseudogymnoascus sp. 24MN13]